ncbi:MAG: hypothetical protein WA125_08720 [Desulfosporosinus sp.]
MFFQEVFILRWQRNDFKILVKCRTISGAMKFSADTLGFIVGRYEEALAEIPLLPSSSSVIH